jgi:hypothetical protein
MCEKNVTVGARDAKDDDGHFIALLAGFLAAEKVRCNTTHEEGIVVVRLDDDRVCREHLTAEARVAKGFTTRDASAGAWCFWHKRHDSKDTDACARAQGVDLP